jgi:hypothetical protein
MLRQGRGLGFFGDDADKIRDHKEHKDSESKLKVSELKQTTNQQGECTFLNVPIGVYSIEVQGNENFQTCNRSINVVNDEDKDEVVIYVCLKPQSSSNVTFNVYSQSTTGQRVKIRHENTNIKAILVPKISKKNKDKKKKEKP